MKRIFSAVLAALLTASLLCATALAAEWYLDQGSIHIHADGNGQLVTQGAMSDWDNAPVITQTDSTVPTENTISISSADGATAELTIRGINHEQNNIDDIIAIDVQGDSSARVTVEGDNTVNVKRDRDYNSEGIWVGDSAAIVHVGEGSLTIDGSGTLEVLGNTEGAKIGSNQNEDLSGKIHITGDVTIVTGDNGELDGAAIGTGDDGNLSGSVIIDGNADVTAIANDRGAGIGTGEDGNITQTGQIVIGGGAVVYAESHDDGAGIGIGDEGKEMAGTIIIEGDARVTAKGAWNGAGIGGGENADITSTGSIIIRHNAQVAAYGGDDDGTPAPAIGAGGFLQKSEGSITITDNARVTLGVNIEWADDEGVVYRRELLEGNGWIGSMGGPVDPDPDNPDDPDRIPPDTTRYTLGGRATINGMPAPQAARATTPPDDEGNSGWLIRGERDENGNLRYLTIVSTPTPEPTAAPTPEPTVAPTPEPTVAPTAEPTPEPTAEPTPKPVGEPARQAPLFRVTDLNGREIAFVIELEEKVVVIRTEAEEAVLTGQLWGMKALAAQGAESVRFVSGEARSEFDIAELLARGAAQEEYFLTHDEEEVAFILGREETDIADILKKDEE